VHPRRSSPHAKWKSRRTGLGVARLRANCVSLSTVGDLDRWHRALLDEKVLSKEAKAKYQTPHITEGLLSSSPYGYGWSIGKTPHGTRLIEHNGSNMIFYADFRR
jgi:CubicO group peptidase (beta-lactamase class C family)